MEVWKSIEGFENYYQISNLGRVRSLIRKSTGTNTKKEIILKPEKLKNGYLRYNFSKNSIKKRFLAHRIVAKYFIENYNNKKCVNHINGIRDDNRSENLEWNTHSENSIHGYIKNKRKNSKRKLSEKQVFEIRTKLINSKRGIGLLLAKEYNVSTFIISLIKNQKTYKKDNLG